MSAMAKKSSSQRQKNRETGRPLLFLGKYDAEPYKYPTTLKNLADRAAKLEHECKSNEKLLTKKNHAIYTVCASSFLTFFYPFFPHLRGVPNLGKELAPAKAGRRAGEPALLLFWKNMI